MVEKLTVMNAIRWEMGSEFQMFENFRPNIGLEWSEPFRGTLHVNGRAALRSIVKSGSDRRPVVWIPTYICSDVYHALNSVAQLYFYGDYPDESAPRLDTISARPGDSVLIQDTFGLADARQWDEWKSVHPEVVLIEDISHSCTQNRYLDSPAHHVFASLRKSLPVADGGIVFDRSNGPSSFDVPEAVGSLMKLEAMSLKTLYLAGFDVEKQSFRTLQIAGEELLGSMQSGGCLAHTLELLKILPHSELRSRWWKNNDYLASQLKSLVFEGRLDVPKARGSGRSLFSYVVAFNDATTRDHVRQHLIANDVYPAIHWPPDFPFAQRDSRFQDLSGRLLTLPTDWRYDAKDIERLAALVYEGMRSR